jgi:periplasmic copper chaperone A
MKKVMRGRGFARHLPWMAFALGLLLAGALYAQTSDVIARNAWARVPLPSKMDAALYLVVENHTTQRRAIVSVSCDSATAAEMHQMQMVKMSMVMTPVSKVNLPARGKATFDENGYHIMVYGLKTRPSPGDTLKVTLKLDDGTTVPVEATFRK